MLFAKYVSKDFKLSLDEFIKSFNVSEEESIILRNFIMYLSFGTWLEKDYKYLKVNQFVCSILESKSLSNSYTSSVFLDKMKEYLPNLKINGWQHGCFQREEQYIKKDFSGNDHCRLVIETGLPQSFIKDIELEKSKISKPKNELVHYLTGSQYNRKRSKKILEKEDLQQSDILCAKVDNVVELQQKLLTLLNNKDTNSFTKIINANFDSTIELAKTFNFKNELVRDANIRLLQAIKLQPKPFYYLVNKSRRLYCNEGITNLKRELRKELTKGWIEFDITNCHLAIIAKEWNIKELQKFLKEKISMWKYLASFYNDDIDRKEIFKRCIYSLVYGDSKANISTKLKDNGFTTSQVKTFFNIDLIKIIFDVREIQLRNALYNATDCFGKLIKFDIPKSQYDRKPNRSVLSQKAQAIELKMLEPLLEYDEQNKHIMFIALYQFDGFSMVCKEKNRIKNHCNVLKKKIDAHIKELGYDTGVEYIIN